VTTTKTEGAVGGVIDEVRGFYLSLVETADLPDEFWDIMIGRQPTKRKPLTDAEIMGILYIELLDEQKAAIAYGDNRAKRRAKKK